MADLRRRPRAHALRAARSDHRGQLRLARGAWRFKTDNLGPRPEFNFESTPLMVGGRLYSTAGTRRSVVALDAATGELLWVHSENEGARGAAAPRQLSGRGLAYWTDGTRGTHPLRHARLSARRARREDRQSRGGLRPQRHRRSRRATSTTRSSISSTRRSACTRRRSSAGNVVLVGAAFETGANPKSRAT